MRLPFDRIPIRPNPSEVEQIFVQKMRGKISERDYHIQNAQWVATNLGQYSAKPYIAAMPGTVSYIDGRLADKLDYDRENSRRLGIWVHLTNSTRLANVADLDLIIWAIEKLLEAQQKSLVDRLMSAADSFRELDFPEQLYQRGLWVLERDALARQRNIKQN